MNVGKVLAMRIPPQGFNLLNNQADQTPTFEEQTMTLAQALSNVATNHSNTDSFIAPKRKTRELAPENLSK